MLIFGYRLEVFSLSQALGFLLALLTMRALCNRGGVPFEAIYWRWLVLIAVSMITGYGAGYLLYRLANPESHAFESSILGAIVFIPGFLLISDYTRQHYASISILTLGFIIQQIVGKIGCFFAGCCYGVFTSSWIGMRPWVPMAQNHGDFLVPIQLFEAAAFLAYLVWLSSHVRREGLSARNAKRSLLYFAYYCIVRFASEFWRGDQIPMIAGLSRVQLLMPIVFLTTMFLARRSTLSTK